MQLIKITTKQVKYEMVVNRAKLESEYEKPSSQVTKNGGQFDMKSKNIKVKIDSYESRKSMGILNSIDAAKNAAQIGKAAGHEAVAKYVDIGNQMAQIHKGAKISDIMYDKLFKTSTTKMVFLPSVGPQISWDPNQLSIDYKPVKLDFKWSTQPVQSKYVPGSIEFNITQHPSVEIEYIGGFNYVPKDSDPNK
ncbi:MAG: DUF6470 family protein [Oscillospiraceae bacterium]